MPLYNPSTGGGGGSTYPGYTAPVALTYAATVTPDCNDGLVRKTSLTGNITLNEPTNPVEGMGWEWWVTCDGTARTLSLHANILIPTDSGFTSPKTLTINKMYILKLKYKASAWTLVSLVGGF